MYKAEFEIREKFGVLSVSRSGWSKELNLVSWNKNEERFDIREWSADHDKMSKGVTMTRKEAEKLFEILREIFV